MVGGAFSTEANGCEWEIKSAEVSPHSVRKHLFRPAGRNPFADSYLFFGYLPPEPDADKDKVYKDDQPKKQAPAAKSAHH